MKRVENTVAKGEIAHHEQFLLLPQLLQKSSAAEASERGYMWERVNLMHVPLRYLRMCMRKGASLLFVNRINPDQLVTANNQIKIYTVYILLNLLDDSANLRRT